jgi:hypothetical protein
LAAISAEARLALAFQITRIRAQSQGIEFGPLIDECAMPELNKHEDKDFLGGIQLPPHCLESKFFGSPLENNRRSLPPGLVRLRCPFSKFVFAHIAHKTGEACFASV